MTSSNFGIRLATVLKKEPFADKGINDAYKREFPAVSYSRRQEAR